MRIGSKMEAYENMVARAMETEGLLVAGPKKFAFLLPYMKQGTERIATTWIEVDLIGMSADRLILASVKSYFGSGGTDASHFLGEKGVKKAKGYRMIQDPEIRELLGEETSKLFGFTKKQIEFRFYSGLYKGDGEQRIRDWADKKENHAFGNKIQIFNVNQVVDKIVLLAEGKGYVDDASIVAIKAFKAAEKILEKTESKKQIETLRAKEAGDVGLKFPLGTKVQSKNDQLTGIVVGYSNQNRPNPYVTVQDEKTGVSRPRAASTLVVLELPLD